MSRSPKMQKFVDSMAESMFGRSNSEAIQDSLCVTCGEEVCLNDLRDPISSREYGISGMCQKCQDSVFGH